MIKRDLITWIPTTLYGWALSQHLPYGGFKWIYSLDKTIEEWKEIINLYDADSETGYIFEMIVNTLHRYMNIRGLQWKTLHDITR